MTGFRQGIENSDSDLTPAKRALFGSMAISIASAIGRGAIAYLMVKQERIVVDPARNSVRIQELPHVPTP
tara:strand:+ start:6459 stop:6668 length:210 start_codon:yes stop_codon:yes gene_type:complete